VKLALQIIETEKRRRLIIAYNNLASNKKNYFKTKRKKTCSRISHRYRRTDVSNQEKENVRLNWSLQIKELAYQNSEKVKELTTS
jgi:predicted ATP-dependent protease